MRPREPHPGEVVPRPRKGLLAVDRERLYRLALNAGVLGGRAPAVNLPDREVFHAYRGLDGQWWPEPPGEGLAVSDGFAPLSLLHEVDRYAGRCGPSCDVIVIGSTENVAVAGVSEQFECIGFDVGTCESEWSHFSCILNEVLYGTDPELRAIASLLNGQLLLPDMTAVNALLVARRNASERGADLETIPDIAVVPHFCSPTRARPFVVAPSLGLFLEKRRREANAVYTRRFARLGRVGNLRAEGPPGGVSLAGQTSPRHAIGVVACGPARVAAARVGAVSLAERWRYGRRGA